MKNHSIMFAQLFAFWLSGCSVKVDRASFDHPNPEKQAMEMPPPVFVFDAGPSPELSLAVDRGEAGPAGPVNDDRFRRWWSRAELLVLMECQKGHIHYLREWLKLADESEQKFLDRIGLEPLYSGDTAALQLKTFQLVRSRVTRELNNAEGKLARVQNDLSQLEAQSIEK